MRPPSQLFSVQSVPSSAATAGTALAEGTYQNFLFRIPILGTLFKFFASCKAPSRATLLNMILVSLLARMWWKYSVPIWIKRNVYKVLPKRWIPPPQTVTGSYRAAPAPSSEQEGLFSLPALTDKLRTLFSMAKVQLKSPLEGFALQGALLATLQIMDDKGAAADEWNSYYASSGNAHEVKDSTELLDGLHLSDWAYLEETVELQRYVHGLNCTLIRHVKTDEPGRVGHYVAINPKEKLAFIIVKGTSELNDMITDACGVPVRHNITKPDEETPWNISCHEGVLTASLALAEEVQVLLEEFFIPTGYHVRFMGHSLGAGVACLTALLLRSRLGKLPMDVLAYAPPPMLNYEASVACKEFCTSIVNEVDVVPRASLFNLVALLRFLSFVNERLVEQGLSPTGPKSMISLWQRLQEDKITIMTPKEVFDKLREAVANTDLQDMDHLFVPGNVIMMYRKLQPGVALDKENVTVQSDAILSDGACQLLKIVDLDKRMLEDHMPNAYEATLLGLSPVVA